MKKIYLFVLILLAVTASAFAQETATLPMVINPDLYASLKTILLRGVAIFAMIEGLKNVPGFANIFIKWPKLSVWVNAVAALLMGFWGCLGMSSTVEAFGFGTCILLAVGTFIAAAGVHLVVQKVETTPTVSGSATGDMRALAEARIDSSRQYRDEST